MTVMSRQVFSSPPSFWRACISAAARLAAFGRKTGYKKWRSSVHDSPRRVFHRHVEARQACGLGPWQDLRQRLRIVEKGQVSIQPLVG